jgi:hypothetical protein
MFQRRNKKWSELSRGQQRAILGAGAVQVTLQAAALWDLRHRSDSELRGSRRWWIVASFVNYLGPIAYVVVGRRRSR